MADRLGKGTFQVYNIIEYFRGVQFKLHGPFEGEWQVNNYLENLPQEDGVEYQVVEG